MLIANFDLFDIPSQCPQFVGSNSDFVELDPPSSVGLAVGVGNALVWRLLLGSLSSITIALRPGDQRLQIGPPLLSPHPDKYTAVSSILFLETNKTKTLRNNGILFKNFCLIGILGKNSHHRAESRFIPVAPRDLVKLLIYNLGVFRPVQELWARFHEYLHPRIKGNLTSGALSAAMGDITEKVVKARLTITKWRKVVETIMRRRGDPHAFEISKKYFFHAAGNHSASTANARYQQAGGSLPGISPEHVAGCIKHSIWWQHVTGIDGAADGKQPLMASSVGSEVENVLNRGGASTDLDMQTNPRDIQLVIQNELQKGLTMAVQRLEGVVQHQIAASTIQSQALYYPRPKPSYAAYELPDVSDIQPHPSRPQAIRKFLGDDWLGFTCPEQAIVLETMIVRTSNVLYIGNCASGKTFHNLMAAFVFGGYSTTIAILHQGK
ncbi:hypothetical protein B0H13DRAFT_2326324 [Mycena leptocephala]|nr:hypothetical protein B0H13DRAFT_2326324 [Mycena leptocephala]